ncbi:MAG: esterase/lipase superfamily enzyme [Crocinitomix sp.]|jgi:esterase/lipase superfamily enzyme
MSTYLEANNEEWKNQIQGLTQLSENGNAACLVHYKAKVFLFTVVSNDFSNKEIEIDIGDLLNEQLFSFANLNLLPIVRKGVSDLPAQVISDLEKLQLCFADLTGYFDPQDGAIIQAAKIVAPSSDVVYGFLNGVDIDAQLIDLEYEETHANIDFYQCDEEYDRIIPGAPILDKEGDWLGISLTGMQGPGIAFGFSSIGLFALMDKTMTDEISNDGSSKGDMRSVKPWGKSFSKDAGPVIEYFMEDSFPKMEEIMEEIGVEEVDFEDIDQDYVRYDVLYGTNRRLGLSKSDGSVTYTNIRDHEMHVGVCEVSIPKTHKMGEIERPGWFRDLFFGESTRKDFTILNNEKLERAKFLALLDEKIGSSDKDELLLFIHGFNVDYDAAMMNAAQLGFDLNYKGSVTAFSWPSLGTVPGYVADTATARASAIYLANFIELVGNQAQRMNIIAHSMGNVVLTDALIILKNENRLPSAQINEIILAAPDLDKDIFVQQIIPKIKDIARFTLYASSKDRALIASRTIRAGYNRLGEGGEHITIVDGLESIDASDVDTSLLGHGYFTDTLSLINDIHQVLMGELPQQRILVEHLRPSSGEFLKYWKFKRT